MGIQQNIANVIRVIKEQRGVSIEEFSEELEIARSTLQEYINGTGNPRAATIDHLAEKLGVDPVFLVSGAFDNDQLSVVLLLLDTIKAVAILPHEQRRQFAILFLEMVNLWTA